MTHAMVGVLRGGPSSEYEISLQTGNMALRALRERHRLADILISKDGTWHRNGIPMTPGRALSGVDVVFNALHGEYGEDGKAQRLLEIFGVPYTGSRVLPSSVGMQKTLAKERFRALGFKTPRSSLVSISENLPERLMFLFRSSPMPVVVKPAAAGSSLGVSVVHSFAELEAAVKKAFAYGSSVLIEEHIRGEEVTCGVVEGYRGQDAYPLFPVMVKPQGSRFYDHDAKSKGRATLHCPSPLSNERKREVEKLAADVHKGLGLRHYSRVDCIVSPSRGIYLLEVNTLPGLYADAPMTRALEAAGLPLPNFLDHVLGLAVRKKL
jgi:D-alanine-D-alanine ligase